MSTPSARVRRDGHVEEILSDLLVPGDIVSLEAGDVVPADMRLLEVNSLKIEDYDSDSAIIMMLADKLDLSQNRLNLALYSIDNQFKALTNIGGISS